MSVSGTAAFLVNMLTLALIYSILAVGLNLQWGHNGLFNISVAAFWGVGAYTAALMSKAPGADTAFAYGIPYLWIDVFGIPIPFPAAIVIAGVVAGILAVLIGIPTLRLRADYLAIATLGLAEVIRLIMLNETWLTGGGMGSTVNNPLQDLAVTDLALFFVCLITLGLVYWLVERGVESPWGRAIEAIRDDEEVAQALGKNTFGLKMQVFVIGSVIMAIAGALTALRLNFLVPPQFIPEWTFYIWIAVIVGGSGSNRGAILGAFFLTVLLELPRFITDYMPAALGDIVVDLRFLIIGLALILIVTYRPEGILGDKHIMLQN